MPCLSFYLISVCLSTFVLTGLYYDKSTKENLELSLLSINQLVFDDDLSQSHISLSQLLLDIKASFFSAENGFAGSLPFPLPKVMT